MGVSNCIYRSTKVVTLSFYWACKYEPLGSAVTSVVPTLKLKATVQRYCKRSTKQGPGRAGQDLFRCYICSPSAPIQVVYGRMERILRDRMLYRPNADLGAV